MGIVTTARSGAAPHVIFIVIAGIIAGGAAGAGVGLGYYPPAVGVGLAIAAGAVTGVLVWRARRRRGRLEEA